MSLPALVDPPAPSSWPTAPLVARLQSVKAELDLAPHGYGPAVHRRLRLLSAELDDVSELLHELSGDIPSQPAPPEPNGLPGVVVDATRFSATVDGEPLRLTYREFRLLQALVEHRGRVLSRNRLMALAWDAPPVAGGSRTIDVHVRRLRVALGAASGRVVTVRRVGYRFE